MSVSITTRLCTCTDKYYYCTVHAGYDAADLLFNEAAMFLEECAYEQGKVLYETLLIIQSVLVRNTYISGEGKDLEQIQKLDSTHQND